MVDNLRSRLYPRAVLLLLCAALCWGAHDLEILNKFPPNNRSTEFYNGDHMDIGVRFNSNNAVFIAANKRALTFLCKYVDMTWHEDESDNASLSIVELENSDYLYYADPTGQSVAIAQFPWSPDFHGWIFWNKKEREALSEQEAFDTALHEDLHVLGVKHSAVRRSVMFSGWYDGGIWLLPTDLQAIARFHKLRPGVDLSRAVTVDNTHSLRYHIAKWVTKERH